MGASPHQLWELAEITCAELCRCCLLLSMLMGGGGGAGASDGVFRQCPMALTHKTHKSYYRSNRDHDN